MRKGYKVICVGDNMANNVLNRLIRAGFIIGLSKPTLRDNDILGIFFGDERCGFKIHEISYSKRMRTIRDDDAKEIGFNDLTTEFLTAVLRGEGT